MLRRLSFFAAAALTQLACASSPDPIPASPLRQLLASPEEPPAPAPPALASAPPFHAAPIQFGFDSAAIPESAHAALAALAAHLRARPTTRLLVSGHADDRGTVEYNLALGDRRASAARAFLVRLGIDGARIAIVSYGEERPAVEGDGEHAWSRNRRDELELRTEVATLGD